VQCLGQKLADRLFAEDFIEVHGKEARSLLIREPLKQPGTRFAREHHGNKAGRIWRIDRQAIDGIAALVPRRCPDCHEIYTYDKRETPCCPECGEPPEELPKRETEEIQRYRRLKAAKRARIIYRS